MTTTALEQDELKEAMQSIPNWRFENDKIHRDFKFSGFVEAMAFILKISYEAERLDHHPEILNVYNRVTISINTHSAGCKVTESDIRLAARIERLF